MPIELSNDEKERLVDIARTAAQKLAELWDLATDLGRKYNTNFDGTEQLVPQWASWLDFPPNGNSLNSDDMLAMFLALPQRNEAWEQEVTTIQLRSSRTLGAR